MFVVFFVLHQKKQLNIIIINENHVQEYNINQKQILMKFASIITDQEDVAEAVDVYISIKVCFVYNRNCLFYNNVFIVFASFVFFLFPFSFFLFLLSCVTKPRPLRMTVTLRALPSFFLLELTLNLFNNF